MQKTKHSKFKNTGILFELLTRQLTADILAGKNKCHAKEILFTHFGEDKELGKEWQLYNFLMNESFLDDKKAERALNTVLKTRERLSNDKLNSEKYDLIREIKEIYPIESFLNSPVKNYKVYASIYKVFEDHTSNGKFRIDEIVQAKECLLENLIKIKKSSPDTDVLLEEYKNQTEDVRLLAYKFLVENLNKKYSDFNQNQKFLLREYINNISNTNSISSLVSGEKRKIRESLLSVGPKINSPVTRIKLTEVVNQLDKIDLNKGVKDNHIMVLLLSYELISEINLNLKKV